MRIFVGALVSLVLFVAACTSSSPVGAPASPSPSPSPVPSPSASSRAPLASQSVTPRTSMGTSMTADVTRAPCGSPGAARTVTFRVKIDPGLPTTPTSLARTIRGIVCNSRSWIAARSVRFRYDPDGALLYSLRTPDNTETRCRQLIALSVRRMWSCATRHEIVLNSARWFGGSPYWPGPLPEYRRMLTNHETGHALGLRHQQCDAEGAKAPVMMQQSKGLVSANGNRCRRNPWPRSDELARL